MAHLKISTNTQNSTFKLSETFTIGRDRGNDLRLLDDKFVSRHHAMVKRNRDAYVVEDMGSRNGTFVERGEDTIRVSEQLILLPEDVIRVGSACLVFKADNEVTDAEVSNLTTPLGATRRVSRIMLLPFQLTPDTSTAGSRPVMNRILLIGASCVVAILVAVFSLLLTLI